MTRRTIWAIVILVSGYIALQLTADVVAAKIVSIGGITIPAGTLIFAITFTWRDSLHRRLGREWARSAIVIAAAANIFMAAYFVFAIALPPASFWPNQQAFETVLGVVPRITIASIIAEVVSEWVDTEIYHRLFTYPRWIGVLGSNSVSLPLDSIVFVSLAFAGTLTLAAMLTVIWGQILLKGAITIVSIPLIYAVKQTPIEEVLLLEATK